MVVGISVREIDNLGLELALILLPLSLESRALPDSERATMSIFGDDDLLGINDGELGSPSRGKTYSYSSIRQTTALVIQVACDNASVGEVAISFGRQMLGPMTTARFVGVILLVS